MVEFCGFAGAFLKQKKRMKKIGGRWLQSTRPLYDCPRTDGSCQQRNQILFGHVFNVFKRVSLTAFSVSEVTLLVTLKSCMCVSPSVFGLLRAPGASFPSWMSRVRTPCPAPFLFHSSCISIKVFSPTRIILERLHVFFVLRSGPHLRMPDFHCVEWFRRLVARTLVYFPLFNSHRIRSLTFISPFRM